MNQHPIPVSILIITHNRSMALSRTIQGIAEANVMPEEIVIIHMNEEIDSSLKVAGVAIRSYRLDTGAVLNLGKARNEAMARSSCPYNIFLDVDCIPDQALLERYYYTLLQDQYLVSGRVRYLQKDFDQRMNWSTKLAEISDPDPVRSASDQYPYELFWSLNFACSKDVFAKIGGFDESFCGYGGEDTDFAFQARANGVALITVDALAYHQYHASYTPPVQHVDSIVRNANRFYHKWKVWPMDGWLNAFRKMGLIAFRSGKLVMLRDATPQEQHMCLRE